MSRLYQISCLHIRGSTCHLTEFATSIVQFQPPFAHGNSRTPPASRSSANSSARTCGAPPLPAKLTPRRLEVLGYVAKGLTNEEIAAILGIGANGVKNHLRAIFLSLGVSTRAEAAALATSLRLISP